MDAKNEEEQVRALLQLLPVGISILDADRKPVFTNPMLEKILGLSQEDIHHHKYTRRSYLRADGSEMPPGEFPSAVTFETGQAVQNVEIGIVREDGSTTWTIVSAVPLHRGDWQVLLTLVDITERKQARNLLQTQSAALISRIRELNCFYGIAALVERPHITLNEILQGAAELLPPAWNNLQGTAAKITYHGGEFVSGDCPECAPVQNLPILVHGEPQGSVQIFANRDMSIGVTEQNLLNAVCERLGRIIERFTAEAKLVELATTDPLTGVYNRRHFFKLMGIEIERSQRYGHSLACLMFDVDFFKNVNDSYGHLIGDKVLQEAVQRCLTIIRRVDIFARYGGDEFVILLPETDTPQVEQLTQRLLDSFKSDPMAIDGQTLSITLSIGAASMKGDDELTQDTLLNRADQALYAAKGRGRNQVSIWPAC